MSFGVDLKDLDVALDVAQINPPAVAREDQARETHLALGRRFQLPWRHGLVRSGAFRGQRHAVNHLGRLGIDDHQ